MNGEEQQAKPDWIARIGRLIPAIEKPIFKQSFMTRIQWTLVALALYLTLSHITAFGVGAGEYERFMFFQIVLGAKFGSLMTLGIGPIVTAGILLQLLVGSKIINWDTTKPEYRKKFQTTNKILAITFCFFEAAAFVLAGALPVTGGPNIVALVILQLAMGGVIVVFLDELVSKWGFGSGVSLFIAAGVTSTIAVRAISPFLDPTDPFGMPAGLIWKFFLSILAGNDIRAIFSLLPLIATAAVFAIVVYANHIKVDVPLAFASLRGFGRTWSLKLFYTSNIPVILVAALLANVQMMAHFGVDPVTNCGMLGCFDAQGNPIGGAVYYLSAPRGLLEDAVGALLVPGAIFQYSELLRALTYLLFMAIGAMIFSIFWVNTAGMSAKSVAEQIDSIGMQIPGYRRDPRIIESVLNRYIPALAVMGGLAVGLLAAFADFTGALGTGTGILLSVMIIYNYYEELKQQRREEMPHIVRKVLGEE